MAASAGVSSGGEAVGALAEEDLVDVELEDLVLGEVGLDLEGEQHFRELARERLLAREEEGARDLHGDGRGALAASLRAQVGGGGSHHAHVVDAAVLVEAIVLRGQDRRLHHLRHFLDLHDGALLLAELADQVALRGIDAQRDLRTVIGEHLEAGQVRPQQDDGKRRYAGSHEDERDGYERGIEPPAGGHQGAGTGLGGKAPCVIFSCRRPL
jgi:hypothetical protein